MNKKDFIPKIINIKFVSGYPKPPSSQTPTQYFLNIVGDFKGVWLYCFPIFSIKIKIFSYFKISCTDHETHIFMFGLKNEKLILLIHVVVLFIYKQTDRRTDRRIDLLQMYRS